MAQPTTYDRVFNFQNFQASAPTTPLPAVQVDAEFNTAKQTLDEILNNLALIQRDDGTLAHQSVGREQLAPDVSVGFDTPRAWQAGATYTETSTVYTSGFFYGGLVEHVAGADFSADLIAGKWEEIADFNEIATLSGIRFNFSDSTDTETEPAEGTFRLNNAAAASATELSIHVLSAETGNLDISDFFDQMAAATTVPKGMLALSRVGQGQNRFTTNVTAVSAEGGGDFYVLTITDSVLIGALEDAGSYSVLFVPAQDTSNLMLRDFSNPTATLPLASNTPAVVSAIDEISFVGKIEPWFFSTLPNANWLRCNGETIGDVASGADNEHADYETLFDLLKAETGLGNLGTEVWANGDTVKLPDMRGRAVAGRDDMGASAANRLQVATTMTTDSDTTIVVASATGIAVGMFALGAGIPSGATVTAISGTTVTLSDAATTSAGPGTAVRFSLISDPQALGGAGGADVHALIEAQLAAHDHGVTDPGHTHDLNEQVNTFAGGAVGALQHVGIPGRITQPAETGITVDAAGGDQAHPNVQPTITGDWIILARKTAVAA